MPLCTRRGTFWSAAFVLALCLWSSGAPSVLYPLYAAEWRLPPVVTTSVFATYPLALLVVLLLAGGLSDVLGRRRAMLIGVALIAVGAAVFAVPASVAVLFLGRAVQGLGVGFAFSAANASLVENTVFDSPRAAGVVTTASTSGGLALSLVVGGVLAQLLPLPLVLTHLVTLALALLAFVFVYCTPDDRPDAARPVPGRPAIAPGTHGAVVTATLGVVVAYAVGAVVMSLGAQMARQLAGTGDLSVVGLLLGLSCAVIGATAVLVGRFPPVVATLVGAVVSLLGLVPVVIAAETGSFAMFLLWCVVSGVGYSFAFSGGVSLAAKEAPPSHRARTFSLVYLVSYLLQTVVAVGAGALATALGLKVAIAWLAPVIAVLCVALLIGSLSGIVKAGRRSRDVAVSGVR
ncbi:MULTISPECIES: MFS transporter [Amycolatopsis]|uniref:Predicted arabinose efflux permease, MFS family n=2 Tax=Amycolatopsis TaxID=1813 RepID=A0A1I3XFU5_9PSEU|nr:MFS transporter [Amycolatopsis sacchari]SFK18408.1 Predicted arabinose efflux permease, MFS family [Amycolatopsis sacchari]